MTKMPCRLLAAVLVASGGAFVAPLAHAQAAKGDLWESTAQISIEGMPMKLPATTQKVCSAKEWTNPPGSVDKQRNCKNSNMKAVGSNKFTWDVTCTGPTMTGTGEMTRTGADAYSGTIKFTSAQGNMTLTLSGSKVGDCDNPQ